MLLYLLDKHGLLKRAAGIVALLAFWGLAWIFGQQQYQRWKHARYVKHHAEIRASLIAKYNNAIAPPPSGSEPAPKVQWDDERSKTVSSAPLDELDKVDDKKAVLSITNICKEEQWEELDEWERNAVVSEIFPKWDVFDRVQFVDRCR